MIDEQTNQKLAQIDQWGNKAHGEETWTRYCDAIRRDRGGISEAEAVAIANSPDPLAIVERAAKEAMLARMPSSTRSSNDTLDPEARAAEQQAERSYMADRQAEREAYARAKGRIR